jgi:Flp pilus assembly protein TadG
MWDRQNFARLGRRMLGALFDRGGNIAVISAFVAPVLIGAFGLGFETANWYQTERLMQNAADSAVVAAASNGGATYATEAKSVTSQYGFTDGANRVTVTAANNATCPSGATNCYQVTISQPTPLVLAELVGYAGDTTVGGSPAKNLSATAIAVRATSPRQYCILALAESGNPDGILGHGVPFANLNGCDVFSNTNDTCTGHNMNAGYGDAAETSSGCGAAQTSNLPVLADPYAYYAANIPTNTCGSYPQEPAKKKGTPLPASNQLTGSLTWGATTIFCGDVQLTGDTTITSASPGSVIYIENGQLDSNGYTFTGAAGSHLTVVFTGTAGTYTHAPTGGGTFNITGPTSGAWKGVAFYQDPALTTGVDISAAGNSPTWDIQGLIYLPHSSVTFSGAVGKSTNGLNCFVLVVDNITVNGTADVFQEGQCPLAGLDMPVSQIPIRGQLVS